MSYFLEKSVKIIMPRKSENPVVSELLSNYTYGEKWDVEYCLKDNVITIGEVEKADLDNAEFVLNITDSGVYLEGKDYSATMRGFIELLERIRYRETDGRFYLEAECVRDNPKVPFRCAHLCIFPETKLDFFKKCVRSCAIARFSHIIFEFWGMLKLDCMKELAWDFAYTKEEIREIVAEANALGVEIIPMFNHLGHAANARARHGKHVVLDQNPRYEYMFDSYGWVWKFERADVYELLKKVRNELMEVCGEGSYFHIGCDEAYTLGSDEAGAHNVAEYVNKVAADLNEKGRRTIMWGDMLISRESFPGYEANSTVNVSDKILASLDKNIIVADWQYAIHNENWKTSEFFKNCGFDVLCCPWDNHQNIDEAISTIKENKTFGLIQTTWNTLFVGFRQMIIAGIASNGVHEGVDHTDYAANVTRKALPSKGNYEKSGWSEYMHD